MFILYSLRHPMKVAVQRCRVASCGSLPPQWEMTVRACPVTLALSPSLGFNLLWHSKCLSMPGQSGHRLLFFPMKKFLVPLLMLVATLWAHADVVSGKVVRVADGDTITVLDAQLQQHKIRLAGIDAPERRQAFGQRSREFLATLVASQQVDVETDKTDKYGRAVGKVLLQGRDVNLAVVAAGLAWHYKEYESEQSPSDRMLYAAAEQEARDLRKGLWLDPAPDAPWDWRKKTR